ncbi:MAG: Peroxiredoxin [Planctomycetaceae bacterium]|nr:Peroxiredoxin [Planctomycetaceae bacterium]
MSHQLGWFWHKPSLAASMGLCLLALIVSSDRAPAAPPSDSADSHAAQAFPVAKLPTASGEQVDLASLRGKQATMFVSLSIDCPLSNGYVPALNQLHAEFSAKGISFVALNANDGQSLKLMTQHQKEFQIKFPLLKDAGALVAKGLGLTHCPEVCVVDQAGLICYRGRIDDRYTRRGSASGPIRHSDLQQALRQLLAGEKITVASTEPIGCPIYVAVERRPNSATASSTTANSGIPVATYSKDIAPIVQQHCQECHRPTGIGPFAMENYEDTLAWAADIASFTKNRSMPPWKPIAGHGEFHNQRSLSASQIDLIQSWVRAGCPEGDPKQLSVPREFADSWKMGTPDVILTPQDDYQISADGRDEYRCFVLPTNFDGDRYITAVEVRPGNRRVVHHVIGFVDTTGSSKNLDAADPKEGYATSAGFPGFFPTGGMGGWAPGNQGRALPAGMAKILPKGASIVMQVHYHRTGKPETDRTEMGLYFAKPPITRLVRSVPVMPFGARWSGMKIPANAENHEVRATFELPADQMAVTITPHMHLLGKEMQVTATLPDGTLVPMIHINNWDFNWQESYQFREPVKLPKGTRIEMVAHFDNSTQNPNNPRTPPETVYWGEQTNDEMCIAFIEMVPAKEVASQDELRAAKPGAMFGEMIRSRLSIGLSRKR